MIVIETTHTLEIFKSNGELYWKEQFTSLEDLDKWLSEEMTRNYWDNTFTVQKTVSSKEIDIPNL